MEEDINGRGGYCNGIGRLGMGEDIREEWRPTMSNRFDSSSSNISTLSFSTTILPGLVISSHFNSRVQSPMGSAAHVK